MVFGVGIKGISQFWDVPPPGVELLDPYKRGLHHSAVIVAMVIGLLWSLR